MNVYEHGSYRTITCVAGVVVGVETGLTQGVLSQRPFIFYKVT